MSVKVKTYRMYRRSVHKALNHGMHVPTENNPLGKSGVDTFINDILDIIKDSSNQKEAYKRLDTYLQGDGVKILDEI